MIKKLGDQYISGKIFLLQFRKCLYTIFNEDNSAQFALQNIKIGSMNIFQQVLTNEKTKKLCL